MESDNDLEQYSCPFGCPENDDLILIGKDRIHGLPGQFKVVRCRTCGLMRTNPRPTSESMGYYYPDDYGPYISTQIEELQVGRNAGDSLRRRLKNLFNFKNITMPAIQPGRLLEIGCASGSYLHQMANDGWQVYGIEFSQTAAETARSFGYAVHAGSIASAPPPKDPFDLIVGWMVLEHLHHPLQDLQRLHEWARPGASLLLSVPNLGSWHLKFFKERWYSLHLPNHLFHFTPMTVRELLHKSGWKVDSISFHREISDVIVTLGYVLNDSGFVRMGNWLINYPKHAGKWPYLLYPVASLLARFGKTGNMTISAQRVTL